MGDKYDRGRPDKFAFSLIPYQTSLASAKLTAATALMISNRPITVVRSNGSERAAAELSRPTTGTSNRV